MPIQRSTRRVSAERIGAAARELLDASTLCAIATTSRRGRAHVNTAYFAWTDAFDVVWLSAPEATHSRNVRANPSTAIAVYDSNQTWGEPDRGIQLFGRASELIGRAEHEAERTYAVRFPAFDRTDLAVYRFYVLRSQRMKLFDERVFGPGVFVTARIRRGGLAWERTEIYRAGQD